MTTKVKASSLVLDDELYPRQRIEPYHVNEIAEALRAGVELPPIVIDKASRRVVDGRHRIKAHQKVYGPDCKIAAITNTYETEGEMFVDAVRLNAAHGRRLSTYDQVECIARAESLGLEPDTISSMLNMTKERIAEMKVDRFATYKLKPRALKRTAAHLAGKELTEKEEAYNAKAGGMHQTFYINQVIAMLNADTVDWENQKVTSAMKRLCQLLDEVMKVTT